MSRWQFILPYNTIIVLKAYTVSVNDYTPIGITDWRNKKQPFYIKDTDRLNHIYLIGKTGAGKSTLLLNMAISDIEREMAYV